MTDEMTTPDEPQRGPLSNFYHGWIKPIALVLIVLTTFRSAVADWNDVPTQSMEPNILVGDRIVVNKLAYGLKVPFTTWHLLRWSEPDRGEIVVFYAPGSGERTVKRVVGVPGDEVALVKNRLIINGAPVDIEPADRPIVESDDLTDPPPHQFMVESLGEIEHELIWQPSRFAHRSFDPVEVPDGMYLLMGDNRDVSADYRTFGLVPQDKILGRVGRVAVSLDRHHSYRPRWDRFFQSVD